MSVYVLCLICFPLEGLGTVPLASKWPELCQSGAFLWVLSCEWALYGMCEIYRIWNIKVFFDLWLFDDLKIRCLCHSCWLFQPKKRCFNRAEQVLYGAALKACQLGTHWQQAMLLFQDPASSPTLGVRDTWGYTIILNIIVIPRLGYNGI